MALPDYWQEAARQLAADAVLAGLIARHAGEGLASRGDAFSTLARSIVGQQISVRAADAVWARFCLRVGTLTPADLLACGRDGLAGCGLSQRKTEYLLDLAGHFADGSVDPAAWLTMDDEAVIADLCRIRGIGRWTAEMFLIFNLLRPDVWPVDDIGLQRAVAGLYLAGEKPARRQLQDFGERWRPWRSVATWYLWRHLDPVPVAY